MEMTTLLEKLYGGFLGMNVGIRLGAPVEPAIWTVERIARTYGDIRGYVKEYKHFAADDDTNGPVFFLLALVGEAFVNYAREGIGMFWWGGFGVSTEHTAYLNLLAGIPAPQSGSIRQNGSTIAEQIGGQIFIDTWGLVAPGDPERAARYAAISSRSWTKRSRAFRPKAAMLPSSTPRANIAAPIRRTTGTAAARCWRSSGATTATPARAM